jgi:hypothetical protein
MTLAEAKTHWDHLRAIIEPHQREVDNSVVALSVVAFFGWLPHLTMLVTFMWSCIRFYETKTVQGWLGRHPPKEESDAP